MQPASFNTLCHRERSRTPFWTELPAAEAFERFAKVAVGLVVQCTTCNVRQLPIPTMSVDVAACSEGQRQFVTLDTLQTVRARAAAMPVVVSMLLLYNFVCYNMHAQYQAQLAMPQLLGSS